MGRSASWHESSWSWSHGHGVPSRASTLSSLSGFQSRVLRHTFGGPAVAPFALAHGWNPSPKGRFPTIRTPFMQKPRTLSSGCWSTRKLSFASWKLPISRTRHQHSYSSITSHSAKHKWNLEANKDVEVPRFKANVLVEGHMLLHCILKLCDWVKHEFANCAPSISNDGWLV